MSLPAAAPVVVRRSPPVARLAACCAVLLASAVVACRTPTEPAPQRAGSSGSVVAARPVHSSAAAGSPGSPADSTPRDTTDRPTDLIIWW